MARPQRNDVDYFPHKVTHGKKMFYLREKFGNDGYAVWFMLLEEIGKADYHYLDLSDDVQTMYLSSQFKVTENVLNEIIAALLKFNEFDAELWESNRILFNEHFNAEISDAYKNRANPVITKKGLVAHLQSNGVLKGQLTFTFTELTDEKEHINPERIEKNRIVKKKGGNSGKPEPTAGATQGPKSPRFIPPTLSEVERYITAKNLFTVKAANFVNHYEANGWRIGKNKMKLWKSALSGWHSRNAPADKKPAAVPKSKQEKLSTKAMEQATN